MTYEIVIERAGETCSAQAPGLPGRIATGATREDAERNIQEAIRAYREGLRQAGDPFGVFTEWAGAADSADHADL